MFCNQQTCVCPFNHHFLQRVIAGSGFLDVGGCGSSLETTGGTCSFDGCLGKGRVLPWFSTADDTLTLEGETLSSVAPRNFRFGADF
ncbi:hypothetical protein BaRGS_00023217 [Batillaria attramentaria]|uniref:Uncharacterized protein n=1 Tax=Batillaria attramentaria TaxID=370345 RepID=A0ABD0KEJ7_9CAEN